MIDRIVHIVATNAFAGTERYVANLASAQAERGIKTAVIGGTSGSMKVLLGGAVAHYEYKGPINTVRQLRSMNRPDIVHAHLTTAELLGCLAFLFETGVTTVCTRHIAAVRGSSMWGRLAARVIRVRLDGQIAPSRYVAERIDGLSDVIPTGLPDLPMGAHDEQFVLIAQRLEPEKDTATALRAWALAELASAGWRLVIAGSGSEETLLRQLAQDLSIADSCTFLGHVTDIAGLMARSAIVLCTATAEPFGLSAVEAMACGAAVVASAAGGHLETIGAVDQKQLYEPGNPSAAAKILADLARDSTLRIAYGRRLRLHQQQALTFDPFVERISAFYEATASRPASSDWEMSR